MINPHRLADTFLKLIRIDSPTGAEAGIARFVISELKACGVSQVAQDTLGNVVFALEGSGEPILLNAHLDNIPPCQGVKPVRSGDTVSSDGTTVLGADDKAGVAIILEVIRTLFETGTRHRAIEVALTVREERNLEGVRSLDFGRFRSRLGICLDASGPANTIVVRAPWASEISVAVHGKAAHSSVNPQKGVNAIAIAAAAINSVPWGLIDEETAANVGVISGGRAVNVVPDLVTIACEARSLDLAKLESELKSRREAFTRAAAQFGGQVDWNDTRSYSGYQLPVQQGVVRLLSEAMHCLGMTPNYVSRRGATDANIFNENGIEMAPVGVGYLDQHSTEESLNVGEMRRCCSLVHKVVCV